MSVYDDDPEEFEADDDEEEGGPFLSPGAALDDEDGLEIPGVGDEDWEAADRDEW